MDQVFAQTAESSGLFAKVGYPRRMLRRLFVRDGVGPGSRVLDFGCADGALVAFLDQLGLRATGVERSPERLAVLRRDYPNLDWQAAIPVNPSDVPEFDLIVVRQDATYAASMLSPQALRQTGELLAELKPGGTLAFVTRRDLGTDGVVRSHEGSCFLKHIECFPGECRSEEFPDGLSTGVLRRLAGTARLPGFLVATLTVPREPVARTGWLRFAEIAARSRADNCCAWGTVAASVPAQRSAA